MLALLLSGLFSLLLFAGFGFFAAKILKLDVSFAGKMLMGIVAVNTLTAIISIFFPVNSYVLVFLIVLVAAMVPFIKNDVGTSVGNMLYKPTQLIVSLLFIFPGILIALNAPDNYDTGLYHTQAIKWIEEYPVIPGLANLHGRFGFNPNVFCLFALTSFSSVFGQHIYSINLAVFIIIVPWFVNSIYSLHNKQGISGALLSFVILFLSLLLLTRNLTSPSPDFLSLVLTLFIFANVVGLVAANKPLTIANYFPILILSVYIITVKLSALPVLLLPLLLLFRCKPTLKQVMLLTGISAIIILPWLTRNVILSGWLVYPFPSADLFNFDWKVPLEKVANEHKSVTGWARNPGPQYAAAAHMSITGWFPLWFSHFKLHEKLFIAAGLIMPLIALALQVIKKTRATYFINVVIITAFAGTLFWLFTAPVFRFGIAFIVAGILSPLLITQFRLKPSLKPALIFNICILLLWCGEVLMAQFHLKNAVFELCNTLIKPRRLPEPAESIFKVHVINGLKVYEPLPGDQCFSHGLPCTPYPDKTMLLRGKTISSGFKVIAQ
ncbi:MAG: hypothetical protein ABIN95_09990 [Mucilaginibacter sp.]